LKNGAKNAISASHRQPPPLFRGCGQEITAKIALRLTVVFETESIGRQGFQLNKIPQKKRAPHAEKRKFRQPPPLTAIF